MSIATIISRRRPDAPTIARVADGRGARAPAARLEPETLPPSTYWEARAHRFATRGAGLGAVCSYGMPAFYNRHIHFLQARALRRWLRISPGTTVLDIGCGIGRWSRRLARLGADVTGIDLAPTMVREARQRAEHEGIGDRCRFLVADVAELPLAGRFECILGVTVLQHVLDAGRFQLALGRLAGHLTSTGRILLLEAAPSKLNRCCDSAVFTAREERFYREAFGRAGLRCVAIGGVDPAPFKIWFLPWYGRLPRPLAVAGLFAVTAAGLPIDAFLARWLPRASWHKLFVLARSEGAHPR